MISLSSKTAHLSYEETNENAQSNDETNSNVNRSLRRISAKAYGDELNLKKGSLGGTISLLGWAFIMFSIMWAFRFFALGFIVIFRLGWSLVSCIKGYSMGIVLPFHLLAYQRLPKSP